MKATTKIKPVYPHLAFSELTGIVYIVLSKNKKVEVSNQWFRIVAGEWEKIHLTPTTRTT